MVKHFWNYLQKVSLLIVGVFALCHSIRWIPNIWEMRQAGTDKVQSNFSINLQSTIPISFPGIYNLGYDIVAWMGT